MIRDTRFHRWGDAQRLMYAAEIIVREVQCDCCSQILPLFRERICQPSQAADMHSHGEILALYV